MPVNKNMLKHGFIHVFKFVQLSASIKSFIRKNGYLSKLVNPSWRAKIARVYKQHFTGRVTLQPGTT